MAHKEESSAGLLVCSVLGIFILGFIIEPIVMVMSLKKKNKDMMSTIALIISALYTAVCLVFLIYFFLCFIEGATGALV